MSLGNKISRRIKVKNENLNCQAFFEELIKEGMEQRLITEAELEKIL